MQVKKRDGSTALFNTSKVRRWVQWSVEGLKNQVEMEHYILAETLKRLPDICTTEEIHQTIINVCLDKEEMQFSRVASKLEMASIFKSQERLLGVYKPLTVSFTEILDYMELKGLYKGDWLRDTDLVDCEQEINECLIELESYDLDFTSRWRSRRDSRSRLFSYSYILPWGY